MGGVIAPHGTAARYCSPRVQCRCMDCREANRQRQAEYRKRRYLNGGQPLSVKAHGAQRRMRALQAIGWPLQGFPERFDKVLSHRVTVITKRLHDDICALYEEYSHRPGPSKRTRQLALTRGWWPPLAWDDIDDEWELPLLNTPMEDDEPDPIVVERLAAGAHWRELGATRRDREAAADVIGGSAGWDHVGLLHVWSRRERDNQVDNQTDRCEAT